MQIKNFSIYNEENKAVKEAYSLLTADISFKNEKESVKTLTLTSCSPKVGKTAVAINLSISMARTGFKTLLVDADLRKPSAVKRLSNEIELGISDISKDDTEINDLICNTNIQNLFYLSSGNNNDNPIEMLNSDRFEKTIKWAKDQFDYVIFDTPSLSSVVDGALVAAKTDATILIAAMGSTKLSTLKRSKLQLETANANLLGVVLNKVKKRDYRKYVEAYDYFFDIKRFKIKVKTKRKSRSATVESSLGEDKNAKLRNTNGVEFLV